MLRGNQLYAKLVNIHFIKKQIQYLGHITNEEGIVVDPKKIEVIMGWNTPKHIS